MSSSNQAILQRAFELIENDELDQAQELLAPLLESDADNPALWWVYTHAVQDSAIGQAALERVLALDPEYPGARELLADAHEIQAPGEDLAAFEGISSGDAQAVSDIGIDDWEDLQATQELEIPASNSRNWLVILLVLLLIVGSAAALVLTNTINISELLSPLFPSEEPVVVVSEPAFEVLPAEPVPEMTATTQEAAADSEAAEETVAEDELADEDDQQSAAEATTIASDPDETEVPEATPTALPVTKLETEEIAFVELVGDAIDAFSLDPSLSASYETSLGSTLVIQVCAVPGPEFNARLNNVRDAVATLADQIPEAFEAVAAGLLNCDDPEANLRIIAVPRGVIEQFANQEIDARDFQSQWQPLS